MTRSRARSVLPHIVQTREIASAPARVDLQIGSDGPARFLQPMPLELNEDYSLPAADFWKPATTQAINIGPPIGTVRISQTILDRSSQPEPSASASKNL